MSDQDPLLRRLADANPVPPGSVDGAHDSQTADRILERAIAPDHYRGRRRTRVALSVAAAFLVAFSALAIVLSLGSEPPATAAELLRETARVAERGEAPSDNGRYLYTKTVEESLSISPDDRDAWSVIVPVVEESWIAADGSGRIRSVPGEPRFPGPRDRKLWRAAGSPALTSGISDNVFPPGSLSYVDVDALPTDQKRLPQILEQEVGEQGLPLEVAVFLKIGELLGRSDAPPLLRGSLYRVASGLPGLELVGPTADPLGRAGVAVSMSYTDRGSAVRVQLIFDEATSRLLSYEEILLEAATWTDARPGTRLQFTAFVASERTHSTSMPA